LDEIRYGCGLEVVVRALDNELAITTPGVAVAELKLIQIDDSIGVILPKELLVRLGVGAGDSVFAIEGTDCVILSITNSEFEEQVAIGRNIMKERQAVLAALAKY
jgi:putative addiction module antidote